MAYKQMGGWLIKYKLFTQIRIANELWYYGRKDGSNERQYQLFFVGWYDTGVKARLFTINILWVSLQVGFPWPILANR